VAKYLFITAFCIFYFAVIIYLGVNFYFNASIKKSCHLRKNLARLQERWREPGLIRHKLRFTATLAFILVNISLFLYVLYSLGRKGKSLSTPFILIFGGNMFIYVFYYVGKKVKDILLQSTSIGKKTKTDDENPENAVEEEKNTEEDEKESWLEWSARKLGIDYCMETLEDENIQEEEDEEEKKESVRNKWKNLFIRWLSFILFGISVLTGLLAVVFYANKHQSRNLTPAESRDKNQRCQYGDFFDNHDIWHFLSSISLYYAFLGLLTIDDDLLHAKRKKIPVF